MIVFVDCWALFEVYIHSEHVCVVGRVCELRDGDGWTEYWMDAWVDQLSTFLSGVIGSPELALVTSI